MLLVLNPDGVDTLITLTTTEFDVDEHPADKTGNSKYTRFSYYFKDKSYAQIICFDMSKKLEDRGEWDALYITLTSDPFATFMNNEAY